MKRAVLAAVVIWASVASMVLAGSPPPAGGQDDMQIREYRAGWGVMVRVPKLGDYPLVTIFEADPSHTHDHHKVGPYAVDIEWGAGPEGAPVVTIEPIGDGK